MRRDVTLIFLAISIAALAACPKKPPEESAEGGEVTQKIRLKLAEKSKCPEKMAWVGPANVCIDIYEYPNVSGEKPLAGVSYSEAEDLCKARGKRLPTAVEWEKACGGKDVMPYPYGEEYEEGACWVDRGFSEGAAPSGTLTKCTNKFGIYDMTGNLWEWTSSEGFEKGTKYVKGGSWRSFSSVAVCNFKAWEPPEGGGDDYGFRCAYKP